MEIGYRGIDLRRATSDERIAFQGMRKLYGSDALYRISTQQAICWVVCMGFVVRENVLPIRDSSLIGFDPHSDFDEPKVVSGKIIAKDSIQIHSNQT